MKTEIENKLSKIAEIWNDYIWEYRECNKHIKFTAEAKTNYFGDILGYLQDTFEIVFEPRKSSSLSDTFANNISLLQTIYVHQDFIEELLDLFKCKIDKGELKKDENYYINRDLRNELIGHPFRKINGRFISSTVFSYHPNDGCLDYLRYHVDNNYQFESKSYKISEIIERHKKFLSTYFDKILERLKVILFKFLKKIEEIEKLTDKVEFEILLKILSIKFESILNDKSYLYERNQLLTIYKKKDEHIRYQNVINKFNDELKNTLTDSKENIMAFFEEEKREEYQKVELPILKFADSSSKNQKPLNKDRSYHYELGKLSTKREFEMYASFLKKVVEKDEKVAIEIENMRNNIFNDIEYYSSYYLLRNILKN